MPENHTIEDFFLTVPPAQLALVQGIHDALVAAGCKVEIKSAKSGYVVSYRAQDGKVLANYVMRKKGVLVRIYGDKVGGYQPFLDTLPSGMRAVVKKAGSCKRLLDPAKCNSRCPMGNVFVLDGEEHKKCRYGSFMFLVEEESAPYIRTFLEKEMAARA